MNTSKRSELYLVAPSRTNTSIKRVLSRAQPKPEVISNLHWQRKQKMETKQNQTAEVVTVRKLKLQNPNRRVNTRVALSASASTITSNVGIQEGARWPFIGGASFGSHIFLNFSFTVRFFKTSYIASQVRMNGPRNPWGSSNSVEWPTNLVPHHHGSLVRPARFSNISYFSAKLRRFPAFGPCPWPRDTWLSRHQVLRCFLTIWSF